jgi:hypothetical protein
MFPGDRGTRKCYPALMPACSICANSELAATVNQLLFEKKSTLQEIADKVGSTKSSVGRHAAKCFLEWKATRVKDRKGKTADSGRLLVQWPNEPTAELQPGDSLLVVCYQETNVADVVVRGNPRALGIEHVDALHEFALAENAERETLKPASECPAIEQKPS